MTMPDASSITMRPAVLQDLTVLTAIDARCFRPGIAYPQKEIAALLRARSAFTLLAERDNAAVAFISVRFRRQLNSFRHISRAELVTIDVLPDFRRQGLGRLLLQAVEEHLRAGGCPRIELHVAVDNTAAISFYDGQGYRLHERVPDYYPEKMDAWRMSKALIDP